MSIHLELSCSWMTIIQGLVPLSMRETWFLLRLTTIFFPYGLWVHNLWYWSTTLILRDSIILFVTVSSILFMCVCHMISPCRTLSFTALSKYFPSLILGYYGIRTSNLEGNLSPLILSILAISHNLHSILKGLNNWLIDRDCAI